MKRSKTKQSVNKTRKNRTNYKDDTAEQTIGMFLLFIGAVYGAMGLGGLFTVLMLLGNELIFKKPLNVLGMKMTESMSIEYGIQRVLRKLTVMKGYNDSLKYTIVVPSNYMINKKGGQRYYIYLRIKKETKYVYLKLTEQQVRSLFEHYFAEFDRQNVSFFTNIAVLNEKRQSTYTGKISDHYNMLETITDFKKINDEQHKGLDVYTGPLYMGYLVKRDGTSYEDNVKDCKVYLDVGGWYVANTKTYGFVNCNPKKKGTDNPREFVDCFRAERYKTKPEYTFLTITDAIENDSNLLYKCNNWKVANELSKLT